MAERKSPAEEAEELRAATREAHEAMQDMRALIREMGEIEQRLRKTAGEVFEERMMAQVSEGLARYGESIGRAIEDATQAVYKRFDTIADVLLGEDRASRRTGRASLADYAERAADSREGGGS